jgi:hypothetical protein
VPIGNGSLIDPPNEVERKAASDANAVQDGVNIIAIVGAFHRHLLALKNTGIFGDNLINHPVAIVFTSKLIALCRLTDEREMAALRAIDRIENGESVDCEVISI